MESALWMSPTAVGLNRCSLSRSSIISRKNTASTHMCMVKVVCSVTSRSMNVDATEVLLSPLMPAGSLIFLRSASARVVLGSIFVVMGSP